MNTVINHPVLGGDLDLAGRPTFSSSTNPRHPIYWHRVFQICKKSSVFSKEKVILPLKSKCGRKVLCGSSSVCYTASILLTILLVLDMHFVHMHTVYILWALLLFSSFIQVTCGWT